MLWIFSFCCSFRRARSLAVDLLKVHLALQVPNLPVHVVLCIHPLQDLLPGGALRVSSSTSGQDSSCTQASFSCIAATVALKHCCCGGSECNWSPERDATLNRDSCCVICARAGRELLSQASKLPVTVQDAAGITLTEHCLGWRDSSLLSSSGILARECQNTVLS